MAQLTWLVNGCSSGLGEELIKSILKHGDRAIVTCRRSVDRLQHLRALGAATMKLDATSSQETLNNLFSDVLAIYGDIDVLVNNAGYVEACLLEDASQEQILKNMNTNLFGAVNLTRAVLPIFRKKEAGVIVWIGSCSGWQKDISAGPYCATTLAMEGIVECLQKEIVFFGIKSILFEPGLSRTKDCSQPNIVYETLESPEYTETHNGLQAGDAAVDWNQQGDPAKAAERMVDVVRKELFAADKEWEDHIISADLDPE
ncbi:hypothetical protein MMC10_009904 [Thelotrema lepadinum]|nr:hypothetical protein [Thelotrema lepadinum]